MDNKKIPELLSPAGSFESLRAAIQGGADAVYFGGKSGNARAHAKNFTDAETAQAINMLHAHGKRAYITLNTLHTDRELPDMLKFAELCHINGADAFILQDLGLAGMIKEYLPEAKLHASTQAAGHNSDACKIFKKLGFSRMVAARELDAANLSRLVRESPVEIEIFVHGALCSSHSGRCYMSFALGNTRSANRGLCAQPCRLEYARGYRLSLRDLCLAGHIRQIIRLAPASLKIEGRMKRPEYVYHTARIYRACLDERRDATEREISELAQVFSRGFTDGYFTRSLGAGMYGVRADKADEGKPDICRPPPLANSDIPPEYKPAGANSISPRGVCDFGGRMTRVKNISVNPKLALVFGTQEQFAQVAEYLVSPEVRKRIYRIFLPFPAEPGNISADLADIIGVRIPAVIFDGEMGYVRGALVRLKAQGVRHALVDNAGHINISREAGLEPFGNAGLNIANTRALETYKSLGLKDALLSPELKFAQARDIGKRINAGIIAYGRLGLMISENRLEHSVKDKTGARFPVADDFTRSILYNSVPVYLADRRELYRNLGLFFVSLNFTFETPEQIKKIISGYALPGQSAPPGKFTRGYK